MTVKVHRVEFRRLPLETRFPFRYGIAAMTAAPYLFVHAECEFADGVASGVGADLLPPKWFTKNPDTTFEEDDLPSMQRVIRHAAELALQMEPQPSVFAWWRGLYDAQMTWANECAIAPLLAGFGVSLIERAVLAAFCQQQQTPLHQVLRENRIGIDLAAIRPQLKDMAPADCLAATPPPRINLRHTIGLGDPLTDDEIALDERVDDGLPQSLQANIREYGLRYFKIKLRGDLEIDGERLERLAELFESEVGADLRVTVDGNENYENIDSFREHWRTLAARPRLRDLLERSLMMVEQPIHRDFALADEVGSALERWTDAPPIIIDESDGDLTSAPRALELGYRGVSHKNCKGVLKGLANAAEVARLSRTGPSMLLSAEDLANYGPVALLQDLAVVTALGVQHVERNGHHYFAGLSGMPASEQERVLSGHPDLFHRRDNGLVALHVDQGTLHCESVNAACFGYANSPDLSNYPLWDLLSA